MPSHCKNADPPPSEARSNLMARVKSADTKPELIVRSVAHRLGFRFRLHQKSLPGSPDLVFPRHRKIVFVHGCFWHRHKQCSRASTPKTRVPFWEEKFAANIARDARNVRALQKLGWKVLVIWECQTSPNDDLRAKILSFLG